MPSEGSLHCKEPIPKNSKQRFPEKELRGRSPNFHVNVSVSDLYIPTIDLPVLLQKICGLILGIYKSLTGTWMWVEIGIVAAQFPEKEEINEIFVAVCGAESEWTNFSTSLDH